MIRVSYRRDGEKWVGVLRVADTTLVECGHLHTNRDVSTRAGGEAAQVCARMILTGARKPATAAGRADRMRRAWQSLRSAPGFVMPRTTIEKARTSSETNADAYLTLVDTVRAHPDLNTAPPTPAPPGTEPDQVGTIPDWML